MHLELRHVRALLAIADTGSISAAARVLGIPQPSLTAQLQRLEKHLGTQLFERGPKGVGLTPGGQDILPILREIEVGVACLENNSARMPSYPSNPFHGMFTSPTVAALAQKTAISTGQRIQAHVIIPHDVSSIVDLLGVSVVETIESSSLTATTPNSFIISEISVDSIALCLGYSSDLLAPDRSVKMEQLKKARWVSYPAGSLWHQCLLTICAANGFYPDIAYFVASEAGFDEVVTQTDAVGLTTNRARGDASLVYARLQHSLLQMRRILAWDPVTCDAGFARLLVKELRRHFNALPVVVDQ